MQRADDAATPHNSRYASGWYDADAAAAPLRFRR